MTLLARNDPDHTPITPSVEPYRIPKHFTQSFNTTGYFDHIFQSSLDNKAPSEMISTFSLSEQLAVLCLTFLRFLLM